MQALCLLDVQGEAGVRELDAFLEDQDASAEVRRHARALASEVWDQRTAIDGIIAPLAEHWDMERMSPVDRNVTRVGVCELVEHKDVPAAVVIDEAIEISKEYGGADSAAFVNGILDAVLKRQQEGAGPHGAV
jgi:N utilization substance protein B